MLTKSTVEVLCQLEQSLVVDGPALEGDGDEEEKEEKESDHSVGDAAVQQEDEEYADPMKWVFVMVEKSQQKRAFTA